MLLTLDLLLLPRTGSTTALELQQMSWASFSAQMMAARPVSVVAEATQSIAR
jgi:hypothetical protein